MINPPARKLFSPTGHMRKESEANSLKYLVNSLFPVCKDACVFQYVDMGQQEQYPPEADVNVEHTIELTASAAVPPSMMERANASLNVTDFLSIPIYTQEDVSRIEEVTCGQSDNDMWFEYRRGMITGSIIHDVYTRTETITTTNNRSKNIGPLLSRLTGQTQLNSDLPSLKYGRLTEPEALQCYKKLLIRMGHHHVKIDACGLFVLAETPYIGASPDSLVTCSCCGNGLVEIKCPSSISHLKPQVDNVSYLEEKDDGSVGLKVNDRYYSQIQTEMAVTNRSWCDLFVYTRHGNFLERIIFNENKWSSLLENAKYFMKEHLAAELISPSELSAPTIQSTPINNSPHLAAELISPSKLSAPIIQSTPINNSPQQLNTTPDVITPANLPKSTIIHGKRTRPTRLNAQVSRPIYLCPHCKKDCKDHVDIIDDSENSVGCDGCGSWFHWGCVQYKDFNIKGDWFCQECIAGN